MNNERPDEAAVLLQAVGDQPLTTATPVRRFEIMAPLAAEDEELMADWIGADVRLDLARQTIGPFVQINRTAGEIDRSARINAEHGSPFIARSTRPSAFSFTDVSTFRGVPLDSVISLATVLSGTDGKDEAGSGSRSGAAGVADEMSRGPSLINDACRKDQTVSEAPIAITGALRTERRSYPNIVLPGR